MEDSFKELSIFIFLLFLFAMAPESVEIKDCSKIVSAIFWGSPLCQRLSAISFPPLSPSC